MTILPLLLTAAGWAYVGHWLTFQWAGLGLERWSYVPDLLVLWCFALFRRPVSRRRGWLIVEQGFLALYFYASQIIKLRLWGWPLMPSDFSAIKSLWLILGDMNHWWLVALVAPLVLWLLIVIFNWRWPNRSTYLKLGLFLIIAIIVQQQSARVLVGLDRTFGNSYWDQKTNYAQRGPWLYLLQEAWRQQATFKIPDQTAVGRAVKQLKYQPAQLENGNNRPKPNVYFIVVESLWQPDLPVLQFSRSPWADNWQQLMANGSGQGLSPTFGGKTANAEFELLCGWPDVQTGMIFNGGIRNQAPCLPNQLKRAGYQTAAFHANVPAFWNRQQVYPLLGFDHFYSLADYQQTDMNGEFMADSSFFEQTLKKIKAQDRQRPSFNYLLTYSSHLGYPLNASRPTVVSTTPAITAVAERYFNSLYYTTKELAYFIEQLHQFDSSAVVLVIGDHWPFLGDDNLGYRQGGWWPDGQLSAQQVWNRSITPLWGRQGERYWLKDQQLAFYQVPDALWRQLGLVGQPFATWSASQPVDWRPLDSLGEPSVIKTTSGEYQFCHQESTSSQCQIVNQLDESTKTLILDIFRGQKYSNSLTNK